MTEMTSDLKARLDAMVMPCWERIGHPSPIFALEEVGCDLLAQLDAAEAQVKALKAERDDSLLPALVDLVNQIRKCEPEDRLGHPMMNNRAFIEAVQVLDEVAARAALKMGGE